MKPSSLFIILLLCVACGNKTKEVDAQLQEEVSRINEVTDKLMRGETPDGYVEPDLSYLWEKGYLKNEFGEEVKESPFIKATFPGQGDRGDAKLEILFSKTNGLILTVYGGSYGSYVNCTIKAKLGDNVIQLMPTDVDGSSILFQDMEQIHTMIELLECKDIFKLSIVMNTGYIDMNSSFNFSITGYSDVKKALAGIGIELGYNGNYDNTFEDDYFEDDYDVTKEDPEVLMNRVFEEE